MIPTHHELHQIEDKKIFKMGTLTATPTTLSTIMMGSDSLEIVPTTTAFNKMGFLNYQYTPFIIDPDCHNSWTWDYINFSASLSAIQLKPTGVRASCMPDPQFWDETFDFHPGVCPHDWIMYDIGRANVPRKEDDSINARTTAYCCPQGYTMTEGAVLGMTLPTERACFANFPTDGPSAGITVVIMPSRAHSGPITRTFEFGDVIQPAWHLIWDTTDQTALSPPPPTLGPDLNDVIATWTPPYITSPSSSIFTSSRSGAFSALSSSTTSYTGAAPTATYESSPRYCEGGLCGLNAGVWFLMIGLPIIIVLLLVSFFVYWFRQKKKAKRADALRRTEEAERAARGEPDLVVVEPGRVKDVDNVLEGGKKEGGLALPVYTKEVTEAPPAYTPAVKEVKE